jgi:DNA-binding LytR/AlgR family response regulator
MNCVLIDENISDLNSLNLMIKKYANIKIVGKFSSTIDAKVYIEKNSIDLIFLNIGKDYENSFSFLDNLKDRIKIIFTSYNTDLAFRSFNYNCLDYLKKPIDENRLKLSIKKSHTLFPETKNGNHIYVKSNLKKRKVFLSDILWIEGLGDYIRLVTNSEKIVILSSLKSFESELPNNIFLRIHKSYIVNLKKIDLYESKFVIIGSKNIPLSRNKKQDLETALKVNNLN